MSIFISKASNWFFELGYFWLIESSKQYWKNAIKINLFFEDSWACFITLKNLFSPLYQDYSILGRVLGPIFRLGRIAIGLLIHCLLFLFSLFGYLILLIFFLLSPIWLILNLI